MLQMIGKQRVQVLVASLAVGFLPLAAQAATINIIVSGMDVQYFNQANGNAGAIYDSIAHPGGNLNTGEADSISSVTFQLDAVDEGTVVSPPADPMFADFRINAVGNPLPFGFNTNIGNNGGGFGFDWFTAAGLADDHLRLGMTDLDVLVLSTVPAPGVFFFAGTATLLGTHDLPFNLQFTSNTVNFSYTATQVTITQGQGANATKVMAVGAFTITGEGIKIPEPAAILLGSIVGACALPFRRRRAA